MFYPYKPKSLSLNKTHGWNIRLDKCVSTPTRPMLSKSYEVKYNHIMIDDRYLNAAGRAITFLEYFRAAHGTSSRERLVRHTLGTLYEIESSDSSALMNILSDLWKLPVQIEQSLKIAELPVELYETTIKDLVMVLSSMQLDSSSRSVLNGIPKNITVQLGMISGILQKLLPESITSEEKTKEMIETLDRIIEEVNSSGFEKSFKDYVIHRVESIRYALIHYDTLGPEETISRVESMFGGVFLQYSKLTSTQKKKLLIQKLLGAGAAIVYGLQITNGGFELSQHIVNFLATSSSTVELIDIAPGAVLNKIVKDDDHLT